MKEEYVNIPGICRKREWGAGCYHQEVAIKIGEAGERLPRTTGEVLPAATLEAGVYRELYTF
ncbi:MAG: hypothetical protein IPF52_17530 [Saprospiraceae bacterium]|nr:hypothetical protein [Saprospiraceae bacterium]